MLYIMTGLPGHGKTLNTIAEIDRAHTGKRPIYVNGIPELKLPWEQLDIPDQWFNCPDGSVIVIDEAQRIFPPRQVGAKVPEKVSQFETHRHRGFDIYLITQDAFLIDSHVRRLAGKHIHFQRALGFERCKRIEFEGVSDPKKEKFKAMAVTNIPYPKEYYDKYKSSTLHTVKKQIPKKLWMLPALIVLFLLVGWFAISVIGGIGKGGESVQNDGISSSIASNGQSSSMPFSSGQSKPVITKAQWIEAQTPRIEGLAFTAPQYDQLREPKVYPWPNCVFMKSRGCRCYSQQATLLEVTQAQCMNIVKNGLFDHAKESNSGMVAGNAAGASAASTPSSNSSHNEVLAALSIYQGINQAKETAR